jgi:hypothetical protein
MINHTFSSSACVEPKQVKFPFPAIAHGDISIKEGGTRKASYSSTTLKVSELMDKHGSDDSLGPLMDELGAFVQVQIAGLVNLLEAAYNFFHFRSPSSYL